MRSTLERVVLSPKVAGSATTNPLDERIDPYQRRHSIALHQRRLVSQRRPCHRYRRVRQRRSPNQEDRD